MERYGAIVVVQDRTFDPGSRGRVMSPFSRSAQRRSAAKPRRRPVDVTIRRAFPDDAQTLARLAALDSSAPLTGDALVAEVAGELWAAVALPGGHTIADPFRPTGELVGLLRVRARQLADDDLQR